MPLLRRLFLAAFISLVAILATASVTPRSKDCYNTPSLTLSCEALDSAIRVYNQGWRDRLESAMCVPSGAWDTTTRADGTFHAHVYALVTATNTTHRDSLKILYRSNVCGDTLPGFHTHLINIIGIDGTPWRYFPSPTDSETLDARPEIPFAIVMSDLYVFSVYRQRK